MEEEGLSDADMVHANDPRKVASVFGADAILYITIERWDAQYAVLVTTVTVKLNYQIKSGSTGETLWTNSQQLVYQPQTSNTGNPLANLIVMAITEGSNRTHPPNRAF